MNLRQALRSALALLLGERCVMCGNPLPGAGVCPACWLCLPYTHLNGCPGNPLERLFWSEPNVDRVNAFAWYKPEYAVARLVHAFKYRNRPDLARMVGRVMGTALSSGDFFDGIEAIVPVPLSRRREQQRGYNQSEHIALGLADELHLPVRTDWIERTVDNPSQTTLTPSERHANVEGIFALRDDVFQKNLLAGTQIEVEICNVAITMTTAHVFESFDLIDQEAVLPENDLARYVIDIGIKSQVRSVIGLERKLLLQQRFHIRQIGGIAGSSISRHSLGRRHGCIRRTEQSIQDIPPHRIGDSVRNAVRWIFKQDFNIVARHGGVA